METEKNCVENGNCEENLKMTEEKVFFDFDDNKEMDIEMKFYENGECDENYEGNERER